MEKYSNKSAEKNANKKNEKTTEKSSKRTEFADELDVETSKTESEKQNCRKTGKSQRTAK